MDKLEFDARLARLERRVAFFTAVFVAGLLLVGLSAAFFVLRSEARAQPTAIATPATVVTETTVPAAMPIEHPPAPLDFTEGTVGHLTLRLDELAALRKKGLITDEEFQAKKTQLLSLEVRSANLTPELERIGEVLSQNVLCDEEHQTLKAKILGTEESTRAK